MGGYLITYTAHSSTEADAKSSTADIDDTKFKTYKIITPQRHGVHTMLWKNTLRLDRTKTLRPINVFTHFVVPAQKLN